MNGILAWLHKIITSFHARLAALEAHAKIETPALEVHPEVQAAADAHTASPSTQAPAAAPAAPAPAPAAASATIQTQWGPKALKDFPTYGDFAQLAMLAGRALTDDEIKAWMAATGNGDPRTHSASGDDTTKVTVDPNGAQNSREPLQSFTKIYDQGRWTFPPNGLTQSVPIVVPETGPYVIQMSGSGGAPGDFADNSAHVSVTVTNAGGTVVGSGDQNEYARFSGSQGEALTLTMVADKPTVQDVTLQKG